MYMIFFYAKLYIDAKKIMGKRSSLSCISCFCLSSCWFFKFIFDDWECVL